MIKKPDISEYLQSLESSRKFGPQVVCHRIFPGKTECYEEPAQPLEPLLKTGLQKIGITNLYSHQAQSLNAIKGGNDIIAATPTASGKSLIYNLPVLESIHNDPDMHALYLFPLKALAQDQLRGLNQLYSAVCRNGDSTRKPVAAIYDGDTSPYQRKKIRDHTPPVLITNPDMVHLSLLPHHDTWSGFFKRLTYVVIDEIHTYRGIFGAHISWVLRRLMRIAEYYDAHPQLIMLSATIGNPGQLGSGLAGRKIQVISDTGAPATRKHMLFINPWDSAAYTASQLLEAALKRGLRTIVYTKSRKMTELITMWTKPRLGELAPKLSSYRAGFLPEERRQIEHELTTGNLLGVISTSALELGIDIGDLDLCILVGYPGSIMSTWQRGGRVGRNMRESAVILIAGEDALDQHFMRDPNDFFSRGPEHAALNPLNSRITQQHLHCAAAERPLHKKEKLVTESKHIQKHIALLAEKAVIYQERSGNYWYASRKRPQRQINLRGSGNQLSIIQRESGELIGEIDANRAMKEAHSGAIYLHRSQTMLVNTLDLEGKEIVVDTVRPSYYTRPVVSKQTEILEIYDSKLAYGCRISWGNLKVTEQVTGFHKINNSTGKTISTIPLDLPEQMVETEGLWVDLQEKTRKHAEDKQFHFMGAIHAMEHTMIAMFPLLILCDRNDIGGISCPHHNQTGGASVFIYDGYAGGAGLAQEAYELIEKLFQETEKTIRLCPCDTGCPSCVHSPKCGSGNRPIDKAAALFLLQQILQDRNQSEFEKKSDEDTVPPLPVRSSSALKMHLTETQDDALLHPLGLESLPARYGVFDLETKYSAEEVGGWNRADRMGMSVGVVYDSELDGYVTYLEEEGEKLVEHLNNFDLVIGFNNKRFDNQVLSAYTEQHLHRLPTLDLLEEIHSRLGYRLSLDRLAEQTLGSVKSANGLQALKWYKEGKIKEIVDYCRKDVELTRKLVLFALENGYLLFLNKAGTTVRLPLALDLRISEILTAGAQKNQGQRSGL